MSTVAVLCLTLFFRLHSAENTQLSAQYTLIQLDNVGEAKSECFSHTTAVSPQLFKVIAHIELYYEQLRAQLTVEFSI